jgi:hypothetical protein
MNLEEHSIFINMATVLTCIIHDFSEKCLDSLPGKALSDYSGSTGYI